MQYLKTKVNRKIHPILHSAPCDNYYVFFLIFTGIAVAVAFIVILMTSLNIILSLFSVVTIFFIISVTVAILIADGWNLNIVESTVFSVAAGLSADFTLHYSIAYRSSTMKADRKERSADALSRMGPPIFMGAFTTFIAGQFIIFSIFTRFYLLGHCNLFLVDILKTI